MEKETKNLRPLLVKVIGKCGNQAMVAREIGLTRATVNIVLKKNSTWEPGYDAGRRLVEFSKKIGIS